MTGDSNSYPYDNMKNNLKKGIQVVKDVDDNINKIKKNKQKKIKDKLNNKFKIYNSYISPTAFYRFIEKKVK